ncbi:MAG: pilus assembly protein [Chloroflexota bacterium]|nr:pilus assembly protein [Chloroflexota bacterium]MDQ5867265.1 pilus assembly protein [Chloroflexota bacterium]
MRLRRTQNNSTGTHRGSGRTQAGSVELLRKRARGQAVVEMALLGLFLAMLLAAAVDFGRAYYTAVVIENMAGEGAAYAAQYPERELGDGSCSIETYSDNESIQRRVRDLAMDRGLVIEAEDRATSDIEVTVGNNIRSCRKRCQGEAITVKIKYELDDLFLPGMLGIKSIPITQSATQLILRDVPKNRSCN